jgi:diguanylate cyclase (GGDEF)-like protein/PAS domain S-box-containing protein
MKCVHGLSPELFSKAFPFHIIFDKSLYISQLGKTLCKLIPQDIICQHFSDCFILANQDIELSYNACKKLENMEILLLVKQINNLPLKGEFLIDDEQQLLIFIGSVKLNSIHEFHLNQLKAKDFALHDPSYAYSFIQKAQKMALTDIETFAKKLSAEKEQIRTTLHAIRDAVITTGQDSSVRDMNKSAEELTGCLIRDVIGKPVKNVFKTFDGSSSKPIDTLLYCAHQSTLWPKNIILQRPDQSRVSIEGSVSPIYDRKDDFLGNILVFRDVSLQNKLKEELIFHASHDVLTSLVNRKTLIENINSAIVSAKESNKLLAVLFIDLNRFKNVNDCYGHHTGDQVIKLSAGRLQAQISQSDVVSRVGGDEFAILLPQIDTIDEAITLGQNIIHCLNQPFNLNNLAINIGSSVGISIYPNHATDSEMLMKYADAAMYQSKNLQSNYPALFSDKLLAITNEQLNMEHNLHTLSDGELQLYYQPKVSLLTGEVSGCEALLRWQHPIDGLIMPDQFIKLAEKSRLIRSIGVWVIRTACLQISEWRNTQFSHIPIAVNVSALQFSDPDFVSELINIVTDSQISAHLLELEFTETILIQNIQDTISKLARLRAYGFRISLDDFGTGYSSLSYLRQLPTDTIKIDSSFIKEITFNKKAEFIAITIIQLSHALNKKVIAEGVETIEQYWVLKKMNCDEIQGYFLSEPIYSDKFTDFLRQYQTLSIK